MANHYPFDIYNEIKRQFVEEGKSPREIAPLYSERPSHQTVARWAKKKDPANDKLNWYDLRDDYQNKHYESMSTKQIVVKIYEQIHKLMQADTIDADKLVKLTVSLERLADPKYHIPLMYEFQTRQIEYLHLHYPHLVTAEFLEAIRSFKNELRVKLTG